MSKSREKKPLISIITPAYNSGRYIEECILSVLAQDYSNVEHIIQDGGSKDNTLKIFRKYSRGQYGKRIKWVSRPDKGQSDGLNKALQRANGDILLVLNADDVLMPYACPWAVEQMDKYPKAGVIYGDTYIINEKSEIIDIYKGKDYDFEKLLCVELVPPAQAAFIRRSVLEKIGFWADSTLDTCPDYELWIRIGQKFPMKHAWGVVTKYRHYKNPQLDSKKPRLTKRFVDAKREVMDRLFNSPDSPVEIKALKRRAYSSLDLWASQVAFEMKSPKEGVYFLLRSFIRRPTINSGLRIYQTVRMFFSFGFLRIFNFIKNFGLNVI